MNQQTDDIENAEIARSSFQSELIEPLGVAAWMRDNNAYHNMIRPNDWQRPHAEVDIRYAEFIDWLGNESQRVQDAVTLALHLSVAFHAKYSQLEHPPIDDEALERVEETMKRLGVDFLYPINP